MSARKLKPVEANDGSYGGLVLAAFDQLDGAAQKVDVLAAGYPEGSHMAFASAESAALAPSSWERWVKAVEAKLGFDLDGDNSAEAIANGTADGYSLDGAYDAWRAGDSVQRHVNDVRAALARVGGAA